jgi:HIV Tat-specific factor 1
MAEPNFAPFPRAEVDFASDPRVSFSKLSNTFILEAEDESEYEWDGRLAKWVPVVDEALLEQQAQAYAVPGVDENAPVEAKNKKRKDTEELQDDSNRMTKKKKPAREPTERKNRAVYITHLPPDTTAEEVAQVFSRCGVIAEEIDQKKPRIKLYMDEDGKFKGDALVVYFRPESIELAVQLLDDTSFRLGDSDRMRVQPASFEFKAVKETPAGGKVNKGDQKKIIKKTQKLNRYVHCMKTS